jgi:hypothetical protein
MQWMSKVVGPGETKVKSGRWKTTIRGLATWICLFSFLAIVFSISESHFSPKKATDGGRNCKILKGCLDSEDQSHKIPGAFVASVCNERTTPILQTIAWMVAETIVPQEAPSFLLPEQGRAPPSQLA